MPRLAVCSFLAPQPAGVVLGASEIPPHVTLVGNFAYEGGTDAVVAKMGSATHRLPVEARAAGEDLFGPNRDVPVTLVADLGGIRDLHDDLVDKLQAVGCELDEPLYARDGFRPHVTRLLGASLEPGQLIRLDSLSLVDLRPNDDPTMRRVVATVVAPR
jgi:2'-5' RNA ligase